MDNELPPQSTFTKKPKIVVPLIVFILIILAILGFYFLRNSLQIFRRKIAEESSSQIKTYSDKGLGLSFTYPRGWELKEFPLSKGSSLPKGNFNLAALDGDSKVIILARNSYELIMEAQKQFEKERCDGVATSAWQYGLPIYFKKMKILSREAFREPIEEGEIPAYLQPTEPYRLPIMIKRLEGEYLKLGSFKDYPNAAIFCLEKVDKPLKIKATYFSTEFTKKNITDKTLDKKSLAEMDQIISSIKSN